MLDDWVGETNAMGIKPAPVYVSSPRYSGVAKTQWGNHAGYQFNKQMFGLSRPRLEPTTYHSAPHRFLGKELISERRATYGINDYERYIYEAFAIGRSMAC